MTTNLIINILAIGTLFSGVFTIVSKNPVISVIFLISTFVQAAGYLILMGIQFIGISYIVIYVGAIAVLFLFVIMMINIKLTDILETGNQYTKNLPLAISIGSLYLFILFTIIPFNYNFYDLKNILIVNKYNTLNEWMFKLTSLNNNIINTDNSNSIFQLYLDNKMINKWIQFNDIYILKYEQMEVLGHTLYTHAAILLLLLSFILLLSMFATIIISKKQ